MAGCRPIGASWKRTAWEGEGYCGGQGKACVEFLFYSFLSSHDTLGRPSGGAGAPVPAMMLPWLLQKAVDAWLSAAIHNVRTPCQGDISACGRLSAFPIAAPLQWPTWSTPYSYKISPR